MFPDVIEPLIEPDRAPKGLPDGTVRFNGDHVEIKVCTKETKDISTGRRFTKRDIERYRSRHFIFAYGDQLPTGEVMIAELRYGHPGIGLLKQWFDDLAVEFDTSDWLHAQATRLLQEAGLLTTVEEDEIWADTKLTKNDPKIPWSLIKQLPKLPLDGDYQAEFLRLVQAGLALPPAPIFERRKSRRRRRRLNPVQSLPCNPESRVGPIRFTT